MEAEEVRPSCVPQGPGVCTEGHAWPAAFSPLFFLCRLPPLPCWPLCSRSFPVVVCSLCPCLLCVFVATPSRHSSLACLIWCVSSSVHCPPLSPPWCRLPLQKLSPNSLQGRYLKVPRTCLGRVARTTNISPSLDKTSDRCVGTHGSMHGCRSDTEHFGVLCDQLHFPAEHATKLAFRRKVVSRGTCLRSDVTVLTYSSPNHRPVIIFIDGGGGSHLRVRAVCCLRNSGSEEHHTPLIPCFFVSPAA